MDKINRTLILMRHGQSLQWSSGKDHARKLSNIGLIDAQKAGEFAGTFIHGQFKIISSSAVRTVETSKAAFPENVQKIEYYDELYLASIDKATRMISKIDDDFNTLVMVGHNPFITDLVNAVSDTSLDNMKPGGVAIIAAGWESWDCIYTSKGKLENIWMPAGFFRL